MAGAHERVSAFATGVSRFLDSSDLADFTIACGSTEWKVHRLVLSLHSSVLAKACNNGLLESETRRIDLSEHDVSHIKAMIDYLYKFDYEVKEGTNHPDKLCFHVEMCILGDKYNIMELQALSVEKFEALISNTVTQADLATVASAAYSVPSVTTDMCNSIVSRIAKERQLLSYDAKSDELEAVMKTYPDFAIEAAKAMREYQETIRPPLNSYSHPEDAPARTFKCTACAHSFDWYLPPNTLNYKCPSCHRTYAGSYWRASAIDLPA